ncbi:MAG TPA: DsbE family thiol:disulfide interchange protein [Nevskia sp.]|jgi:cytochrome c biogenesis protein CcmG/thiol:disulfide interchange protein DsbE|nr:DsbE family thiol:disulfide interchange protein [Nevskia sp.]
MRFAIPLVILLVLIGLFYVGMHRDPRLVPSPLIGKAAPAFDLPTLDGQPPRVTTADLKGAPVLVNFFASWCAGCQEEHPYLMQLGRSGQVRLLGIDYKDAESDLRPWLEHKGNPYGMILSDLEGRAGIDWGVYGVPETFVVDARGNILFKQVGPLTPEVFERDIQPLLKAAS